MTWFGTDPMDQRLQFILDDPERPLRPDRALRSQRHQSPDRVQVPAPVRAGAAKRRVLRLSNRR